MEEMSRQWLILAVTTATVATIVLYLRLLGLRTPKQHQNLPPSPPYSLPLLGHLPYFLLSSKSSLPHHIFTTLSNTLGPIFHLKLGQVHTIILSSAHWANLILKTHDPVFSNRPKLLAAQILSFDCSDVTFSPTCNSYWRQARRLTSAEVLHPRRVSSFHSIRVEEVKNLVTLLISKSQLGVNLSEKLFELSNNVLCRVAFGRRFIESGNGEKRVGELGRVLEETQELLGGFCVGDFFPEWEWVNWVSGMRRRMERNLEELRKVCDEIIEEHLRKVEDGSDLGSEDLVDVLIRVRKGGDLQVPISDDNLKALVLDMFVAGTDTTFATLEWTMTELVMHPAVMAKVQKEIHNAVSATGQVEETHLQHLHYMKAVIKETMRLHPPVPLLVPRESGQDCTIDGYFIPKKTRIFINTYSIGRDPESWVNPLDFDPYRFLDTDIEMKDQDFRFLPFGGGRRGCPGYTFGLATVELTLANLLYHFNWALPRNSSPNDVDLGEIFGLATRKKQPLILVPTPTTS